jgi:hypothetical protein
MMSGLPKSTVLIAYLDELPIEFRGERPVAMPRAAPDARVLRRLVSFRTDGRIYRQRRFNAALGARCGIVGVRAGTQARPCAVPFSVRMTLVAITG